MLPALVVVINGLRGSLEVLRHHCRSAHNPGCQVAILIWPTLYVGLPIDGGGAGTNGGDEEEDLAGVILIAHCKAQVLPFVSALHGQPRACREGA